MTFQFFTLYYNLFENSRMINKSHAINMPAKFSRVWKDIEGYYGRQLTMMEEYLPLPYPRLLGLNHFWRVIQKAYF